MSFKAWESFNDDRIKLPIGGKEYELPDVSAKLGHALRLAQAGKPVPFLTGLSPEKEANLFLGADLYKQMVADDIPDEAIQRASLVVIMNWKLGRDAAEAAWEAGINPELIAAKLAAKVADSTPSQSSDEATTTPPPASTSGTKSRKTTPRAKQSRKAPVKAAASPGSTSPSSGS